MNNNVKIILTVVSEGCPLVRKSVEIIKSFDGKVAKNVKHIGLCSTPVRQHLNITEEAYRNFVGDNCPSSCSKHDWRRMSKKARLEVHLKEIAYDLKGIVESYEILES